MNTTKAEMKVERQKVFVTVAKKPANDVLSDVTRLQTRVALSDKHEAEFMSGVSVAPGQIARVIAEFCQVKDTI